MSALHEEIKREIPRLEGWVSAERGIELADLIVANQPKVCVEIGVFGGRSLFSQAMALRQNGQGKVYGIDPWKLEAALEGEKDEVNRKWWSQNICLHDIHRGTLEALWRLKLDHWAVIVRAKAEDAAPLFSSGIDHLLIDGCHSEVSSVRDVTMYLPMVRAQGIVYFDDADWPSTQKAVAILDKACDLVRDAGNYRIYRKK